MCVFAVLAPSKPSTQALRLALVFMMGPPDVQVTRPAAWGGCKYIPPLVHVSAFITTVPATVVRYPPSLLFCKLYEEELYVYVLATAHTVSCIAYAPQLAKYEDTHKDEFDTLCMKIFEYLVE